MTYRCCGAADEDEALTLLLLLLCVCVCQRCRKRSRMHLLLFAAHRWWRQRLSVARFVREAGSLDRLRQQEEYRRRLGEALRLRISLFRQQEPQQQKKKGPASTISMTAGALMMTAAGGGRSSVSASRGSSSCCYASRKNSWADTHSLKKGLTTDFSASLLFSARSGGWSWYY